MLGSVEVKAARAARRAALSFGAMICFGVGMAFLTAAAWIYLSMVANSLVAAAVIGAAYMGLGFILLGLSRLRPVPPAAYAAGAGAAAAGVYGPPPPPPTGEPPLTQAFLYGIQAGLSAGRARRAAAKPKE